MIIQRKDITNTLPNGILENGEFSPDEGGLALHMRGFYTIGELKAILQDLIHCDASYQAQQLMNDQSWFIGVNMKNSVLDVLSAIAIGLCLCIGLLAYFDVLVK